MRSVNDTSPYELLQGLRNYQGENFFPNVVVTIGTKVGNAREGASDYCTGGANDLQYFRGYKDGGVYILGGRGANYDEGGSDRGYSYSRQGAYLLFLLGNGSKHSRT